MMGKERRVPFFNYPALFFSEEEKIIEIFRDVLGRGAYIMQRDLEEFEQKLAKFTGARYAIGVANCTDGLLLALRAAGIGTGDEVIFSSHTMTATAAAIHFVGARPVPVDCGDDHLISPNAVAEAITSKTKAIVPTQLNGRTCDMDPLMVLAETHNLLIIEDAAQSLGSKYRGKCAGTFGLASAFSFYPAKTLGCFGDGGAVLTDNHDIYRAIRLLRDHGRDESGKTVMWGINSRLDNLQAAILSYRMDSYEAAIARRRQIASLYDGQLGGIAELSLPPAPGSEEDRFDIFQNYEIEAEKRGELKSFLAERGIGTLIQWGGEAVHQIKAFGFDVSLPRTEKLFERCLMLPMNMSLSDEDVDYVCSAIGEFYSAR